MFILIMSFLSPQASQSRPWPWEEVGEALILQSFHLCGWSRILLPHQRHQEGEYYKTSAAWGGKSLVWGGGMWCV